MSFDFIDSQTEMREIVARRVNTSKHSRAVDNKWNFLELADKKFIDQAIRPISIQREEENLRIARKKVEKELEVEAEKQRSREQFHDKVRKTFLTKHE
jgi:hypothetical protein